MKDYDARGKKKPCMIKVQKSNRIKVAVLAGGHDQVLSFPGG